MYGRKRKYPSSGFGAQGSAKRRQGARGTYFRPARPFLRGQGSRHVSPYGSSSTVIIRQPTGLPDRLRVKLIYRESISWSQTTGNLGDNVYRGNSLFDPDVTGSGGQPYLFDQWAVLYGLYTVSGSAIEVTSMMNGGPGSTQRHGVTPATTSTAFGTTDQELAEERPYTKAVTPHAVGGAANAAVGNSHIKHYMGTAKINGLPKRNVDTDPNLSSLVSTNPATQWYWHVWNYVPGGETQSLYQIVKITYYCTLKTRISPGLS